MTQEDKELLFTDLCNRIHYKTICTSKRFDKSILVGMDDDGATFSHVDCLGQTVYELLDIIEFEVKPYLRPMPSMTPEEREEIEIFIFGEWFRRGECKVDGEGWIEILADYDVSGIDPGFCSDYVDWLNAHHFDYRNLIGLGLALEAPDDMYNLKEE